MKQTGLFRWLAVLLICLPTSMVGMSAGELEAQQKVTQEKARTMIAEQAKQWANIKEIIAKKKYGDAFLDIVQNKTPYDAKFIIANESAMEKKLNKGAIIRIKSLSPRDEYRGKYYTFTDGVFKPTTDNPNDKATLFGIDRFADIMLNEWFGIKATDENYLQCGEQQNLRRLVTADAGSTKFTDLFKQDAHFQIMGDEIAIEPAFADKISRIVSARGGCLHMVKYFRKEPGITKDPVPMPDSPQQVWSVESNWDLSSLAAGDESGYLKYNLPVTVRSLAVRWGEYWHSDLGYRAPIRMGWGYNEHPNPRSDISQLFLIRKLGEPNSIATVHYKDKIEIIPAAPRKDRKINPGAKVCVHTTGEVIGIAVSDPRGDDHGVAGPDYLTNGNQIFTCINTDNPSDTGPIKQSDNVAILSAQRGFENCPIYGAYNSSSWWTDTDARDCAVLGGPVDLSKAPIDPRGIFKIELAPDGKFVHEPALSVNDVIAVFNLNALKVTKTFKNNVQVGTNGFNLAQITCRYQRNQETKAQIKFEAWAVTTGRQLVQYDDDNKSWAIRGIPARWVSAGSDQGLWIVDDDFGVVRLDGQANRVLSSAPAHAMVQVAGQVKDSYPYVWAIDKDGKVWKYKNKTDWELVDFAGKKAVNIAMACGTKDPLVWVVDDKGRLWTSDAQVTAWQSHNGPSSEGVSQVVASIPVGGSVDCCYAIGRKDNKVYAYNGNQWSAIADGRNFVAAVSGFYMGPSISTYKLVPYESATTANIRWNCILGDKPKDATEIIYGVDGKQIANPVEALKDRFVNENELGEDLIGAESSVSIELIQPGTGGSLNAGNQFIFGRFPIAQRDPKFEGYAYLNVKGFSDASMLSLKPMRGKGAAWLSQSLKTPGNATISFLARSAGGGVHVVFDTFTAQREPRFHWRIVIGGSDAKEKKSWIEKGTINKDGEFVSTRVCEVTASENPLAAGSAGSFVPYTVSVDDGLILVSMGGTVFMAWRDPDATYPVNYVGFGTDDSVVDYMQVKALPPMVAVPPKRLFVQAADTVSLSPDPEAISWVDYPFRIADEGCVAFAIQGEQKVGVALGQDQDRLLPHYLITFGDVDEKGNDGISVKKWLPDVQKYQQRIFLPLGAYEEMKKRSDVDPAKALSFKLDPAKKLNAWVSFKDGQLFVGLGDAKHIGSNVLLVLTDLNPYTGIKTVGFGAFGDKPATVEDVAIAENVELNFEKAAELYKVPVAQLSVKGNLDVVRPVGFQILQVEDRVVVHDAVANKNYAVGSVPSKALNYTWMFVVNADGSPSLQVSKGSDASDVKIAYDQLVTQADAQAELLNAQKDSIKASGELVQKLYQSGSEEEKAQADAIASTNDIVNKGAATLMESGGKIPGMKEAAFIAGAVMIGAASAVTSVLANQKLNEAAATEKAGADATVAAQARAQSLDDALAQAKYTQALAAGDANAAFEATDKYVYTDKVTKESVGGISVPAEAQANAKIFTSKIAAAVKLSPITEKNIEQVVSTMQAALDLVTHAAVVQDAAIKKKAYKVLADVLDAYEKILGKAAADSAMQELYNDIITLLFTAYNNVVFVDETVASEKKEKTRWYAGINEIVRTLLADPEQTEFKVDAWYGEYVWFPKKLETSDRGSITFSVKGGGDLFIGLAKTSGVVRNVQPPVDLYEVVINGCGGTTTGVRFESLGKMVAKITTDDNPDAAFDALDYKTYWVNFDNGKIEVGTGVLDPKNTILTCEDRYPVGGFNSLGISSWTDEVDVKDIVIGRSMYDVPPAPAPAPRPTVEIKAPVAAVKQDVATVVAATNKKIEAAKPKVVVIVAPKSVVSKPKSTKAGAASTAAAKTKATAAPAAAKTVAAKPAVKAKVKAAK